MSEWWMRGAGGVFSGAVRVGTPACAGAEAGKRVASSAGQRKVLISTQWG